MFVVIEKFYSFIVKFLDNGVNVEVRRVSGEFDKKFREDVLGDTST